MTEKQEYDAVVEALRKAMCALPRYSFLLNDGGVCRVEDSSGRWIELTEAHKLFDPEVVDWLLAKEQSRTAISKARGQA